MESWAAALGLSARAFSRPGGLGGIDIWVALRPSTETGFGDPVNLGAPVNSTADDFCPAPVRGKGLFFVSQRAGGCAPNIRTRSDKSKRFMRSEGRSFRR